MAETKEDAARGDGASLHRARDRFDALEALSETDLARLEQLRESLDSVARDRTYHFKYGYSASATSPFHFLPTLPLVTHQGACSHLAALPLHTNTPTHTGRTRTA